MRFKDLSVGEKFEFDHSGLPLCHGLEPGPWEKISARCYVKYTDPFSSDEELRRDHGFWLDNHCQVGSINVKVVRCK